MSRVARIVVVVGEGLSPAAFEWPSVPVVSESGDVTSVLRRARRSGATAVVVAGIGVALDPEISPGDLVVLDDQLNLLGESPLVGPNPDDLGPRFPDMTGAFDVELGAVAVSETVSAASDRSPEAEPSATVGVRRGVYAAVPRPPETPGEVESLRALGAVVAGAGIVPTVLVARHMGMRVVGLVAVVTGTAGGADAVHDPEALHDPNAILAPTVHGLVEHLDRG